MRIDLGRIAEIAGEQVKDRMIDFADEALGVGVGAAVAMVDKVQLPEKPEEAMKTVLNRGVELAGDVLPQVAGRIKEDVAVGYVAGMIERYDGLIPYVGPFMDLGPVDRVQLQLIRAAVKMAYLKLQGF